MNEFDIVVYRKEGLTIWQISEINYHLFMDHLCIETLVTFDFAKLKQEMSNRSVSSKVFFYFFLVLDMYLHND